MNPVRSLARAKGASPEDLGGATSNGMNREEATNNLVKTTILLVRMRGLIKDKFFLRKLTARVFNLASVFVTAVSAGGSAGRSPGEGGDSVTQLELLQRVVTSIDGTLETIEDLVHLGLLKTSPLSLRTGKHLLLMKLNALSEMGKLREISRPVTQVKPVENRQEILENTKVVAVKKDSKLNPSKQKILDFIKSYPNTRTKDIIQEFSALSDRTVKRNLTELIHTGVIQKRVDNKAVYYYATQ